MHGHKFFSPVVLLFFFLVDLFSRKLYALAYVRMVKGVGLFSKVEDEGRGEGREGTALHASSPSCSRKCCCCCQLGWGYLLLFLPTLRKKKLEQQSPLLLLVVVLPAALCIN